MKKLLSVVLVLALVLGLAIPAFADGTVRPTAHTTVTSLDGINSVTVNGTTAYYEYDSNTGSSVKYIRAELPVGISGKTEYDLKNATVVIETNDVTPTVMYGNTVVNPTVIELSESTYTYSIDLFNKAYTISVSGNDYTLAAGLADGRVSINSNDPLILSGTLNGVTADVYGSCQNNLYMGNPYYSVWTYINYFVAATLPSGTTISSVPGSFTYASGASFAGGGKTGSGTSVS